MFGYFSSSDTSTPSRSSATTTKLYKGLAFLMLATFAVSSAAAAAELINFPGVTFIPHGVDENKWETDPCRQLCDNFDPAIRYLAQHEGQFKEAAGRLLEYCLRAGCDVIGSVLSDCVNGIQNSNELLIGLPAIQNFVVRGMAP